MSVASPQEDDHATARSDTRAAHRPPTRRRARRTRCAGRADSSGSRSSWPPPSAGRSRTISRAVARSADALRSTDPGLVLAPPLRLLGLAGLGLLRLLRRSPLRSPVSALRRGIVVALSGATVRPPAWSLRSSRPPSSSASSAVLRRGASPPRRRLPRLLSAAPSRLLPAPRASRPALQLVADTTPSRCATGHGDAHRGGRRHLVGHRRATTATASSGRPSTRPTSACPSPVAEPSATPTGSTRAGPSSSLTSRLLRPTFTVSRGCACDPTADLRRGPHHSTRCDPVDRGPTGRCRHIP